MQLRTASQNRNIAEVKIAKDNLNIPKDLEKYSGLIYEIFETINRESEQGKFSVEINLKKDFGAVPFDYSNDLYKYKWELLRYFEKLNYKITDMYRPIFNKTPDNSQVNVYNFYWGV